MAKVGGTIVLRIVSAIMVVLGGVGLVASLMVFGQVEAELGKVDATVQQVATTVGAAAAGVDAAAGVVSGSVDTVVTILNNASKGVGETGVVLKQATATVGDVEKQVPMLITSTAASIESAAKAISQASTDIGEVSKQVGGVKKEIPLDQLQTILAEQQKGLAGQQIVLSGAEVVAAAPWVASWTGVRESDIRTLGEQLQREQRTFSWPLNKVQITGKEMVEYSDMFKTWLYLDTSIMAAEGKAAADKGLGYTLFDASVLKQTEDVTKQVSQQVDGVLNVTGTALDNTGKEMKSLGGSLTSTASDIMASQKDLLGVTNQAKAFLTVADKQLAVVDSGLKDVAVQAGKFKTVSAAQLAEINAGLKGTADAMKGVSVTALGSSVVGGLRVYMIVTNILFILAGVGLFAGTIRSSGALAGSSAFGAA